MAGKHLSACQASRDRPSARPLDASMRRGAAALQYTSNAP